MIGGMSNPTAATLTQNRRDESGLIEPGLLSVFRLVLVLQLLFALVGSFESQPVFVPRFGAPPAALPNQVIVMPLRPGLQMLPLLSVGWVTLLLGYLSWPWLRRQLGRAYLPIALAAITLFILIERTLTLWLLLQQDAQLLEMVNIGSGRRLWMGLLLPMVLIAWQYRLRHVVAYLATVVLASVLLTGWLLGDANWLQLLRDELTPATAFGVIGYIVTLMMAGQRQQRQALAEANVQLAQHAATLEQLTLSRERNRLARELHDTLAHTLSAVSVQLEAVSSAWEANPAKARDLLGKSLAQTRSGLTETRRALQALRASPLDDLGLGLAIRNLAESAAQRGGLQLTLDLDEFEPLPPETEQQIYRIAQESLANVLKHAGAQRLAVKLRHTDGGYQFSVQDDGKGFTTGLPLNGHFGLQGLRERADLLGASLVVESAPGQGTTVRLTWQEESPHDKGQQRLPGKGAPYSRNPL
jgi:signal transduction histidine kinase